MKNKKSLNLFEQNKSKLDKKQAKEIKGGHFLCGCGCIYEGEPGGATTNQNAVANCDEGLFTQ